MAAGGNGAVITEEDEKRFERLDREAERKAKAQDSARKKSARGLDEVEIGRAHV